MAFSNSYLTASDTLAHASDEQREALWDAFRSGQHAAAEAFGKAEFNLGAAAAEALADIAADAFVAAGETDWLDEQGEPSTVNWYYADHAERYW